MTSNGSTPRVFSKSSVIPLIIDGQEVTTDTTFDVTSPLNSQVLHSSSSASETEALAAVTAAERAFPTWSETKPSERRDLFLRAVQEAESRKDEFWGYCKSESGSTEPYFAFEYGDMVESLKSCAGLITTIQSTMPTISEKGRSAIVLQEPYGVVLGIAPWNAPCILGLRSLLAPLAMGNTVVLKGPEAAPAAYWVLVDVFHKAGLPPGCLNLIFCRPQDAASVTTALISAPAVKKINFTGSTAVGSIIAGLAGKHLKPVLMELGGKAPAIVCEDADLHLAAQWSAIGAFLYSGQICMSTERILVHEKVAEEFKTILKSSIDKTFSTESAPVLISAAPVTKNKKLLQDALSKGAKTVYGDPSQTIELATSMRPVVLENIKKDMDLYHTESFGPTVSLFVVSSDEEAIKIANDTEYGLTSAVFTEDLRRGLKIARRIETGAVHINSMTVHDETVLPHGGAKKSGWGRFNGQEGLKEWIRTKTVTWKD